MDQSKDEFNRPALLAVAAIGVANFVAFCVISALLGGDAGNGKVVDGHYFLRNHGTYTEVSEAVFTYSLWHVRSLFITHPLAGLAMMALYKTKSVTFAGATSADGLALYVQAYGRLVRMVRDAAAALRRKSS